MYKYYGYIYKLEIVVSINISDSVSSQTVEISSSIPIISPKLSQFPGFSFHSYTKRYCEHVFQEFRGLKFKITMVNIKFSNIYPLSNPAPGIVLPTRTQCPRSSIITPCLICDGHHLHHCQRTPQSDSHYSRYSCHLRQSPIHPSTQTTEPLPAARDLTIVWPMCLAYVSDLCVRPTWLAYVSTLRV